MVKLAENWDAIRTRDIDEVWERLAPGVERFQMPGDDPVRRIITGRRNHIVGAFWSWKNMRHIAHESGGEERCARLFEVHPLVSSFRGQPEQLRITIEGEKPFRYTPDFLAKFGALEMRVEFKCERDINPPRPTHHDDVRGWHRFNKAARTRQRLEVIAAAYRRANIHWKLILDTDLLAMASAETVDCIVANAGRPVAADDQSRLRAFLLSQEHQSAPLAECENQIQESDFPRGDVLSLVPRRSVSVDLHDPIADETLVTWMGAAA